MRDYLALVLVVGALVAVPALCVGGLIEHPCDCEPCHDRGAPGPGRDGGHEDDGGGCGHEDTCVNDPCTSLVARQDRSDETIDDWPPCACFSIELFGLIRDSLNDRALGRDGRPTGCSPNLPYPPSDLPLLI